MSTNSWIDMLQAVCYVQNGFIMNKMLDELDEKQIGSLESFNLMNEIEIAKNELSFLEKDLQQTNALA